MDRSEYGNLGNDKKGLQKVANDVSHRQAILKEFAAEMDGHDVKRLPTGGSSPLNRLSVPRQEEIKEEKLTPLDWDERMNKWIRE